MGGDGQRGYLFLGPALLRRQLPELLAVTQYKVHVSVEGHESVSK